MSEAYRLVFRGEVLEGQHPAVVRKRLGDAAGFADDQLDRLFSGQPVVVKRAADTSTAARLQAIFRKSGARLRVLPFDNRATGAAAGSGADGSAASAGASATIGSGDAGSPAVPAPDGADVEFELLPPGSDLLHQTERSSVVPRQVDTGSLEVDQPGTRLAPDRPAAAAAPDVSHISVAEVGSRLAEPGPVAPPVAAPDFDIAAAGEDLGQRRVVVQPLLNVEAVDFEVAPAGAALDQRRADPPPPAPDTSKLSVQPTDQD